MYYIIYPLLYLFSLLPLQVLYLKSDFIYFLAWYVVGYRKKVVLDNLQIAFPEKTEKERIRIAKDFYHHFTDTLIETIKFISISEKNFLRRVQADVSAINAMAAKGKNIQLYAGHQMNWEFVNWVMSKNLNVPFVGIYMAITNKAVDRIIYRLRSRYGTVLVPAQQFKSMMHEVFANPFAVGLAADQNPAAAASGMWLNFFGKPAPFITGPSKTAMQQNLAGFFVPFIKVKRGYYRFEVVPMFENGAELTQVQHLKLYRDLLEEWIKKAPSNYLWTHRRWKYTYSKELEHLWVDN